MEEFSKILGKKKGKLVHQMLWAENIKNVNTGGKKAIVYKVNCAIIFC